jgi:hypothetical protein
VEQQTVKRHGIEFIEDVVTFDAKCVCRICGAEFDPFEPHVFQLQRAYQALCGEDCWATHLSQIGVRTPPVKWAKLRAETSDYNIARQHFREQERPTLATISADRQRRIDEVKKRFEAGESPTDIAKAMGHKNTHVYHDLRDGGVDVAKAKATEAAVSKARLLSRIKQLMDEGKQYREIAPIVGISAEMVGYHVRNNFKIDGRSRRASRKNTSRIGDLVMASASAKVLNTIFQNDSGGSSNIAMAHLVVAALNAAAMGESTSKRPLEEVMQACEALVGANSKAVKSLRQMYSGQLSAEAQR